MVDFVNVLVKRTPVQRSMRPVVPCILENEENSDLVCHSEERWEGDTSGKADVYSHWVEEPDRISHCWSKRQGLWGYTPDLR